MKGASLVDSQRKVTRLRDPQGPPVPAENPTLLRVVVPLRGVTLPPEIHGAVISGGWSDPRGTESTPIQRVRVTIEKIFMDEDFDTFGDEWHVYVGVNGRWRISKSIGGDEEALNFTVDLDLHHSDRIRIAATGFEADTLFDHFGEDSGHSWQEISDPNLSSSGILVIASDYIGQVGIDLLDPSDPIGHFGKFFSWDARLSNLPFAWANSEQLANSGWRLRLRTAGWGFEETVRWSGRNAPFA